MPIASLLGGVIGQQGALQAGAASGAAGDKAYQNATDWAKQLRAFASPWIGSGMGANDEIAQLLSLGHLTQTGDTYHDWQLDQGNRAGDQANAFSRFKVSPDYNFRLSEGLKALDRSAASKGGLFSGAQIKGAQQYGGDLASGEFNNYFNKLAGVSGQGLNATNASSGAGAGIVGGGINNQFAGGMGQASAYSNAANALASGIGKGAQNLASIVGYNPWGMFGNV